MCAFHLVKLHVWFIFYIYVEVRKKYMKNLSVEMFFSNEKQIMYIFYFYLKNLHFYNQIIHIVK